MMPAWVRKLIAAATPHIPADFAGHVEIYVSTSTNGKISNVAVRQSWERAKEGK